MEASGNASGNMRRIVPDGWVGLDRAIAWVAFKSALPEHEWNGDLYPGATLWFRAAPASIADELRDFLGSGYARADLVDLVLSETFRRRPNLDAATEKEKAQPALFRRAAALIDEASLLPPGGRQRDRVAAEASDHLARAQAISPNARGKSAEAATANG